MATAATKLWTIDDLADLPDDGRYEVWGGELVEMPGTGHQHSAAALRIGARMLLFVEQHELGDVSGADGGYVIALDPLTVYVPDVAFVRAGRLPENDEGRPHVIPDLVVEVISPSDRSSDVNEKIQHYLAAGVSEVWLVHPRQRMVDVYKANHPNVVHQLHEGDTLDGGEILPGFQLPVADIFRKR